MKLCALLRDTARRNQSFDMAYRSLPTYPMHEMIEMSSSMLPCVPWITRGANAWVGRADL